MVGGMLRHMKSLRSMRRDNGWIHTLLEEAENERMHLLTFLQLRQPGFVFRGLVLLSQVLPLLLLMSLVFFSCCSSSSHVAAPHLHRPGAAQPGFRSSFSPIFLLLRRCLLSSFP